MGVSDTSHYRPLRAESLKMRAVPRCSLAAAQLEQRPTRATTEGPTLDGCRGSRRCCARDACRRPRCLPQTKAPRCQLKAVVGWVRRAASLGSDHTRTQTTAHQPSQHHHQPFPPGGPGGCSRLDCAVSGRVLGQAVLRDKPVETAVSSRFAVT